MRESIWYSLFCLVLFCSPQFFHTPPFCDWWLVWQIVTWCLLVVAITGVWYVIGRWIGFLKGD